MHKPYTWRKWSDANLDAAREDIFAAYKAISDLCEWDDIPRDISDTHARLSAIMDYFESIDRDKLKSWNAHFAQVESEVMLSQTNGS